MLCSVKAVVLDGGSTMLPPYADPAKNYQKVYEKIKNIHVLGVLFHIMSALLTYDDF